MSTSTTQQTHLQLFTQGLPEYEQRIIEATVKISLSRALAIHLVDEANARSAEVIIVDGSNTESLLWARANQSWLEDKIVIWIDAHATALKHITLKRPILWVNLPIIISRVIDDIEAKKAEVETIISAVQDDVNNTKAHILVCDDSQAVRSHLTTMLNRRNYKTTTVDCGEAAIEAIKQDTFDCVLMDVLMPGIDGYRACREILRMKPGKGNTPVIMLTSKTSPFDKIRGKISGCSAYLTKPVAMEKLVKTIERYI